uniref:Uncharacterized protein n=1 Tax=Coccidioides posadasii RMSCC 3488 TaxID=454284 RepID=A0A0J6FCC0_COCPO|nr:hypothetical protein CPAG_02907 [Coccidioides posadasii RMSCC 3488]
MATLAFAFGNPPGLNPQQKQLSLTHRVTELRAHLLYAPPYARPSPASLLTKVALAKHPTGRAHSGQGMVEVTQETWGGRFFWNKFNRKSPLPWYRGIAHTFRPLLTRYSRVYSREDRPCSPEIYGPAIPSNVHKTLSLGSMD